MNKKPIQNKRIRTGDRVVIVSGDDKGEVGNVLSRTEDHAIVQGVNVCKKHVKRSDTHPQGGTVSIERPVPVCKLRYAAENGKPVKLRAKVGDKGQRTLYYREGNQEVTVRAVRKSK